MQAIHKNYKWYLLALVVLTNMLLVAIPSMAMSVLSKEISQALHLSLPQVGIVWGIGALPGILTGLLAGAMGDRLGPRRVLVVVSLLTGLLGAARGLATSFASMTLIVILLGIFNPFINPLGIKTCGLWFPPRQLGLANGLVAMGMAVGFLAGSMLSATVLSPLLGGWRNVFILYGVLGACLSVPWALTRDAPPGHPCVGDAHHVSIRHAVVHVTRLKNIWLLGLAFFGIGGCIQGLLGYLPLYLRNAGWQPLYADGAISAFHTISLIFVLPIALWSDRLGSRKRFLLLAAFATALGTGLLGLARGTWVWACVLLAGFVRDGFMAIFTTLVLETKGIGPTYAGTAWGFVLAVGGIGNVLAPPLGNSLAVYWSGAPFAFWAALALFGVFCLSLYQDEPRRTRQTRRTRSLQNFPIPPLLAP
jgi:MFS family permease